MNTKTSLPLRGALAGFLATFPMTWSMQLLHRALPPRQRYPLPPRQITMRAIREAGAPAPPDEPSRQAVTLVAHYAFGAAMGALYELGASHDNRRTATEGLAVGLGVWAANYVGVLPALGLMEPANRHPAPRTLVMIAAHCVWGTSAAAALALLSDDGRQNTSDAPSNTRPSESEALLASAASDNT